MRWQGLWPLLLPCGLLVPGAVVGYIFTLDTRVAAERLLGLVAASVVAPAATLWLRRLKRTTGLLVATTIVALLGTLWVIAASGSDVFRGPVGQLLQVIFKP